MIHTTTTALAFAAFVAGAAFAETHEVQMLNKGADGAHMVFEPAFVLVATGGPKINEITLETTELLMVVDEDTGALVWATTYNGSVPCPLIICHEGDMIALTLRNPENSVMEHNIDFHALTGALGGGGLTHVYPGEETVLRWKAIKPGCFTYHCAPGGAMIPYHVTHGMNGAVMVLSRDGLKDKDGNPLPYNKIANIGEQDFYLPKGDYGDYKTYEAAGDDYADSLDATRTLTPTHTVFNGAVGALTGEGALKFNVGETVLMIRNQSNRDSRPHLIGGHGDHVWETSFSDAPLTGLKTWLVRGGSATAAMQTFKQPGVYAYANHNLICKEAKHDRHPDVEACREVVPSFRCSDRLGGAPGNTNTSICGPSKLAQKPRQGSANGWLITTPSALIPRMEY